jgi:hypothetical protein
MGDPNKYSARNNRVEKPTKFTRNVTVLVTYVPTAADKVGGG